MNVIINIGKNDLAYLEKPAFETRLRERIANDLAGLPITTLIVSFADEPVTMVISDAGSGTKHDLLKTVRSTSFDLLAEAGEYCEDEVAAESYYKETGRMPGNPANHANYRKLMGL